MYHIINVYIFLQILYIDSICVTHVSYIGIYVCVGYIGIPICIPIYIYIYIYIYICSL